MLGLGKKLNSLEEMQDQCSKLKPVSKVAPLSELRLTDPGHASISGISVQLDNSATDDLCSVLGLPRTSYRKIHKKNPQAWDSIVNLLQRASDRQVRLTLVQGKYLTAITKPNTTLTPHSMVLASVEEALKRDKGMKLGELFFSAGQISIHLHRGSFAADKARKDLYRLGVVLSNSYTSDGFDAGAALERIVCSNLSYSNQDIGSYLKEAGLPSSGIVTQASSLKDLPELFACMDATPISQLLRCLIERMKACRSSVEEVLKVSRIPEASVMTALRLPEIAQAYGLSVEELRGKDPLWRSTATTPYTIYELFNYVTHLSKSIFSPTLRNALRIHGGNLLFERPYLSTMASSQEFPEWSLN